MNENFIYWNDYDPLTGSGIRRMHPDGTNYESVVAMGRGSGYVKSLSIDWIASMFSVQI